MDLGLVGDTALVTAASSGLGKASATALASEGANVVLYSRSESNLDAAAEDIREEATGDVVAVPADLTDPGDIQALVDATVDEFGGLDHLVTSAGGPPSGPFLETAERDWYEAYDLLVMSVVRTLTAAIRTSRRARRGPSRASRRRASRNPSRASCSRTPCVAAPSASSRPSPANSPPTSGRTS